MSRPGDPNQFDGLPRWTPQSFDAAFPWLLDSAEALRASAAAVAPVVEQMLDFTRSVALDPAAGPAASGALRPALVRRVPWKATVLTVEPPVLMVAYVLTTPPGPEELTAALDDHLRASWKAEQVRWPAEPVPESGLRLFHPVIFLLFYIGDAEWRPTLDVARLQRHPPELTPHAPKFKVLSLNLMFVRSEVLLNAGKFGRLLHAVSAAGRSPPRFLSAFETALVDLKDMPVEQNDQRRRRLWYLINLMVYKRAAGEFPRLRHALVTAFPEDDRRREVEAMLRTIFDSCAEIGELKARRETLLDLMAVKFGAVPKEDADHVARIQSGETLSRLLRRVITARNLDDVGLFDAPDAD